MKDYSWSHNCLFCHWCEAATRLLYLLMDFLRSSNTRARCMFCFMIKGIIFSCGVSLSRWHPAIERLRRVLGYLCGFQNVLTDSSFSLLPLICAYISLLMALLISGSNCRWKKKKSALPRLFNDPQWCRMDYIVAQMVKSLPAMQETWVQSLGQEDPWRRKWQSIPVPLPGRCHGWKRLAGYSPWGHKKSDMTSLSMMPLTNAFIYIL